jgi:hypothetical protein
MFEIIMQTGAYYTKRVRLKGKTELRRLLNAFGYSVGF